LTRLVLLPGLDGTGELFTRFIGALRGIETQVVQYPDRAMDYEGHLGFARRELPAEGDYVLLAESFSGPIGIAIAASRPRNLRGLILCATFAQNPLPALRPLGRMVRFLPAVRVPPAFTAPWLYGGRASDDLRRTHARILGQVSPRALRARVASVLAVDYRAQLRRVDVPTMYMKARHDRLIPEGCWREIHDILPGAELADFDAPHFLLQTEPEVCARRVEQFVRRVTG
jgi:pimeloyl-ACP methyl ester carboxylesterase